MVDLLDSDEEESKDDDNEEDEEGNVGHGDLRLTWSYLLENNL